MLRFVSIVFLSVFMIQFFAADNASARQFKTAQLEITLNYTLPQGYVKLGTTRGTLQFSPEDSDICRIILADGKTVSCSIHYGVHINRESVKTLFFDYLNGRAHIAGKTLKLEESYKFFTDQKNTWQIHTSENWESYHIIIDADDSKLTSTDQMQR